jgi:hypothetical protein
MPFQPPPKNWTHGSNTIWAYDIDGNKWIDLRPSNPPPDGFAPVTTLETYVDYDSTNDRVLVMTPQGEGEGNSFRIYDPEANSWGDRRPLPWKHPRGGMCYSGCYDPELNVFFGSMTRNFGGDNGTIWVYRYKRAPEKK